MEKYALFFPQFDNNSINDDAWGVYFNDWILVGYSNAYNLWKQRRAPLKGFYDLRNNENIEKIIKEATTYNLNGFGIYHYYFNGLNILNNVENYIININNEKIDFFLIYANEHWTKRWINKYDIILKIDPNPKFNEIDKHVQYLVKLMKKNEYKKINGKPIFIFYRLDVYENPEYVLEMYRTAFNKYNINPMFGFFIKHPNEYKYCKYVEFVYLFEPRLFFNFNGIRSNKMIFNISRKLFKKNKTKLIEQLSNIFNKYTLQGKEYHYKSYLEYLKSKERNDFLKKISNYNCLVQEILSVGWNNAPRYGKRFTSLQLPSETEFEYALKITYNNQYFSKELPLLVNAWNEWSEGAAIEPCYYLGDKYLKLYTNFEDKK
jgi:hypothetical protein